MSDESRSNRPYRFWLVWREKVALRHDGKVGDATIRDFATIRTFASLDDAHLGHRTARRGGWVTPTMHDPHVSPLVRTTAGGREEEIAPGCDIEADE